MNGFQRDAERQEEEIIAEAKRLGAEAGKKLAAITGEAFNIVIERLEATIAQLESELEQAITERCIDCRNKITVSRIDEYRDDGVLWQHHAADSQRFVWPCLASAIRERRFQTREKGSKG